VCPVIEFLHFLDQPLQEIFPIGSLPMFLQKCMKEYSGCEGGAEFGRATCRQAV